MFSRDSGDTSFRTGGVPSTDADENSVPIVPVSPAEKRGWMRAFAERQSADDVSQRLLGALDATETDGSLQAFDGVLAASPSLARRWRRHYRDKILERVDAWARANDVSLALLAAAPKVAVPRSYGVTGTHPAAASASPRGSGDRTFDEDEFRANVCRVVMQMPLADLLRIPLPAEYMLR
ncbi:hypothetical protein BH11ACT8_BH11ACT8_01810 [soil metagenome]